MSRLSVQSVSTETEVLRLLVISASRDLPAPLNELIQNGRLNAVYVESCSEAHNPSLLANVDAVVLCDSASEDLSAFPTNQMQFLADVLISHRLIGIVLSSNTSGAAPYDDDINDVFVVIPQDTSSDELWGRLAMIQKYRPLLHKIEEQVNMMQRLGNKLNQQFVEVDQELRLAARLQRDFLPKTLPEVGDYRFAALYLPASWVSGDVYDVRRLDEAHIGIYLADAVGHGVAAGLLTMFVKQAIVGKKIQDDQYVILDPGEVLANLNTELKLQQLPNCQFATACYAVIDTQNHALGFSRAGHPYPIHISTDGRCSELRTAGGLLGIFENETFPSKTIVLEPGEKFLMYSDGLEYTIISKRIRERGEVKFAPEFQEMVRQPAQICMERLIEQLDQSKGSIERHDDMTALIIERLPA
ncbi:MAG: SpoIIE family protein phosphatase [Planctomycetota bacterium]|nr:MAG: SpoIIE family protein phosphatase [Planctomycetota bacterium]